MRASARQRLPPSIGFFLGAGALSLSADEFVFVALSWLVLEHSGSSALLGAVLAVAAVPRAVLMPLGGVLADRHGPRLMLRLAVVARGLLVPLLAIAFVADSLWALWPIVLATGAAAAVYYPAETSLLPRLLAPEQLQRGNGLNQTVNQLANMVGPAVAGVGVAILGGAAMLVAASVGYLAAAVVLRGVPEAGVGLAARESRTSVWGELRSSLSAVAGQRGLRWLLAIIAVTNVGFVGPFFVGIPTLVRMELGAGAGAFGMLIAAYGLGAAAGSLSAAHLSDRVSRAALLLVAGAGLVVLFGGVGSMRSVPAVAGTLLAAGACSGLLNVLLVTLIQLRSPQEHLGKMMSLVMMASLGLAPVSQALAGVVTQAVGVRLMFVCAAALMALAYLGGAPVIRRLAAGE